MGLIDGAVAGILAIDAGNSKTDVCVVSADGDLLGSARGGPFRPHRVGATAAVASIAPAVAEALSRAGSVEVRHVAACLANADLPVEHEALEAAIGEAGWAPSYEVVNDTFALLRAGLDSVTRRGGGLRRRDQLHRRAGGRQDGAVRRGRAHLRRLGRRWPPVAGGDVVGGPGRGRPRPRHRAAHRAPEALRALVDGRPDRSRSPRRLARGAVHGADARCCSPSPRAATRSPSTSCGARPTRSSRWRPPRSAASTRCRSRSTWCWAAACSPLATGC